MDLVRVTTVETEAEAHAICGALRAEGLKCNFVRVPEDSLGKTPAEGPFAVVVAAADAERAAAAVADAEIRAEGLQFEPLSVEDFPEPSRAGAAASLVGGVIIGLAVLIVVALVVALVLILVNGR